MPPEKSNGSSTKTIESPALNNIAEKQDIPLQETQTKLIQVTKGYRIHLMMQRWFENRLKKKQEIVEERRRTAKHHFRLFAKAQVDMNEEYLRRPGLRGVDLLASGWLLYSPDAWAHRLQNGIQNKSDKVRAHNETPDIIPTFGHSLPHPENLPDPDDLAIFAASSPMAAPPAGQDAQTEDFFVPVPVGHNAQTGENRHRSPLTFSSKRRHPYCGQRRLLLSADFAFKGKRPQLGQRPQPSPSSSASAAKGEGIPSDDLLQHPPLVPVSPGQAVPSGERRKRQRRCHSATGYADSVSQRTRSKTVATSRAFYHTRSRVVKPHPYQILP